MDSELSSVRVLAKAAAILDRLATEGELGVGELARLTGEPRSTVYRLVGALRTLGYVEAGAGRGAYRLGLELFRLGSATARRLDEREAALPTMQRIHDETGETVFLCVRRGREAVCIERIDGARVQSLALRLGGSLPLHAGGAPRVLLAYEPREFWEQYVAGGPLERYTESTPTSAEALYRALEETRELGYATSDGDVTEGIAAVGAPILDARGQVRAALSVSGIRSGILGDTADAVRALVIEGAREISRALGAGIHWEENRV